MGLFGSRSGLWFVTPGSARLLWLLPNSSGIPPGRTLLAETQTAVAIAAVANIARHCSPSSVFSSAPKTSQCYAVLAGPSPLPLLLACASGSLGLSSGLGFWVLGFRVRWFRAKEFEAEKGKHMGSGNEPNEDPSLFSFFSSLFFVVL